MEIIPKAIEKYVKEHTSSEDQLLYDLYRETHLTIMHPRMLSSSEQGQFLQMMASLTSAKNILEIGTYTGYSAICMARGMKSNGQLHTIDLKEELFEITHKYIVKAGLENQITQHIGNALDIIPILEGSFDLVFIDADKNNYSKYYELLIDRLVSGGLIIADNVLWSGKVVEEVEENDLDTKGLIAFNTLVQQDERVDNVMLPLRDGLMLVRKK
ncbi:MAG: methyltransferase domain-containing protein [Bacteroidales bacterium]|nr:methyltransferase domain-containing protein [Bacteroidales bacterium]